MWSSQPMLEASIVTTVCQDTCSRGPPARRKARSIQGLREQRHCWVMLTQSVPRRHAHLGSVARAEVVSYEATRAAWLQLRMPYAPGASETVSVVPHSCLWRNSGRFSTAWACSSVRHAVILTESNSAREKRFSAKGRACSFPSWPEAPTKILSTTALWIGPR